MQDTGLFNYITPLEGETNPYLKLIVSRHWVNLQYLYFLFAEGERFFLHIKNYVTGDSLGTVEVSEDVFHIFGNSSERKDYPSFDFSANPFSKLKVLRNGAYLGYWIYIFTDGEKTYLHVKDFKTGEPIETKEVAADTFESFGYHGEYIKDLVLLDSMWDILGERIMAGESVEQILASHSNSDHKKLGEMPEPWKAVRDGKRMDIFSRPPLLTGGRKLTTMGVSIQ